LLLSGPAKIKGGSQDPPLILQFLATLGLTARHLLHFALLRSASIVAGLERVLGFALLARSAFCFLAVVFAFEVLANV
jgi:hypothetical protein